MTLRKAGDERVSGRRSIQTWQVLSNLPGRQAGGAGQGVVPLSPEREPRESILRAFDLTVISRTFPAYEREIGGRL